MSGKEFLEQLEKLLKDLPEHDREDAMAYYTDYLEEAGPENEAAVISELGGPEKVAENIKRHLRGNDKAEYTERGYQDGNEPVAPDAPAVKEEPKKEPEKKETKKRSFPWALVIVLAVFASPVLLGLLGGAIGILVSVVAVIFSLGVGLICLVIAGLVGGIALIVAGCVKLVGNVAAGLLSIGLGVFAFAMGLILLILTIWVLFKLIPAVIRFIGDLLRKIFNRLRGGKKHE